MNSIVVLVRIRSYRECVPKGTFIMLPYGESYEFCGLDQMLLTMEDIMDAVSAEDGGKGHRYLYKEPYVFLESGYPRMELKPGGRFPPVRRQGDIYHTGLLPPA